MEAHRTSLCRQGGDEYSSIASSSAQYWLPPSCALVHTHCKAMLRTLVWQRAFNMCLTFPSVQIKTQSNVLQSEPQTLETQTSSCRVATGRTTCSAFFSHHFMGIGASIGTSSRAFHPHVIHWRKMTLGCRGQPFQRWTRGKDPCEARMAALNVESRTRVDVY